ncbi:hypothetical protein MVEN_02237400 [Mycena venus]|uniref:RNase III domain-containing protein n=1 Tax=Mycena venus TaxID=2733690 RepID=A0A8H7CFJ5_9AGAR|nr:hypothetical protein MVEN_02237400 [Mycena venus]
MASVHRETDLANIVQDCQDTTQQSIIHAIAMSTFTPQFPLLPTDGWTQVRDTGDPITLECLESLGDARIAYMIADLQSKLFPNADQRELSGVLNPLLSNATFQHLLHKLGVDTEPVDNYAKAAGDAFEIFLELFSKHRPVASGHWVSDIFTPLVTAAMSNTKKRKREAKPAMNAISKPSNNSGGKFANQRHQKTRPENSHINPSRRRGRRDRSSVSTLPPPASTSRFPSTPFTFPFSS